MAVTVVQPGARSPAHGQGRMAGGWQQVPGLSPATSGPLLPTFLPALRPEWGWDTGGAGVWHWPSARALAHPGDCPPLVPEAACWVLLCPPTSSLPSPPPVSPTGPRPAKRIWLPPGFFLPAQGSPRPGMSPNAGVDVRWVTLNHLPSGPCRGEPGTDVGREGMRPNPFGSDCGVDTGALVPWGCGGGRQRIICHPWMDRNRFFPPCETSGRFSGRGSFAPGGVETLTSSTLPGPRCRHKFKFRCHCGGHQAPVLLLREVARGVWRVHTN